jgi:pimeloyl-ACP methyl ester carboxylesterase
LTALHHPDNRRAALRYYRDVRKPRTLRAITGRPVAPALYLHGVDDGCMRVELAAFAEQVLAPASRTVTVDAAGHFLHLERPSFVNDLIAEWIEKG